MIVHPLLDLRQLIHVGSKAIASGLDFKAAH